jgi:small-conductance mechanosensitive channel
LQRGLTLVLYAGASGAVANLFIFSVIVGELCVLLSMFIFIGEVDSPRKFLAPVQQRWGCGSRAARAALVTVDALAVLVFAAMGFFLFAAAHLALTLALYAKVREAEIEIAKRKVQAL